MGEFLPKHTYASWAHDVRQLASHLQLSSYAVLGFSSGGPNAMACAAQASGGFPEACDTAGDGSSLNAPRLAACGLISPDGPYAIMADGAFRRAVFGLDAAPTNDFIEERVDKRARLFHQSYTAMSREERKGMALADLKEATRQGLQGAAQDGLLENGDWGFELAAIDTQVVPTLLWHGEADQDVPVGVGRWVCDAISGCQGTFIEGENHSMLR